METDIAQLPRPDVQQSQKRIAMTKSHQRKVAEESLKFGLLDECENSGLSKDWKRRTDTEK